MNFAKLDVRFWYLAAAALAVLVAAAFSRWARRPHDPDDAERSRRARINQIGRIAEGRVLEVMEMSAPPPEVREAAVLTREIDAHRRTDRRALFRHRAGDG